MSDYGGITVAKGIDGGRYLLVDSDDIVGISVAALSMAAGEEFRTDADGNLTIHGQLTYRPVRFDQNGRVIVCEKVNE